jgi:serine/threonine protein kinase/tetratricopeptide (TPR) repeat protein
MDDSDLSSVDPFGQIADEFVEAFRQGKRPSVEEFARRYPEHASEIREMLPALVMMEKAKSPDVDPNDRIQAKAAAPLKQLGDYQILREVGRGGMGVVYEAQQLSLGRHVAIKVLPGHALLDPRQLGRFQREARSAAKLHHTNIVPVFGVGEQDGLHYYVMQFIHGLGLDVVLDELRRLRRPPGKQALTRGDTPGRVTDVTPNVTAVAVARSLVTGAFTASGEPPKGEAGRIKDEPVKCPSDSSFIVHPSSFSSATIRLPGQSETSTLSESGSQYWQSVARIGMQVADALAHAAGQGVLHRDIKPSNLLLDETGNVWVTDFGLAKAATDSDDLTHTGDIVGTLRYMAPERFSSQEDLRSDVYSLGLTLYELLTLRTAFNEPDRNKLVKQVMHDDPPRPRRLNPSVPRDLETVVLKAIARDPAHRYQTPTQMTEDLERFVEDRPVRARRISEVEKAWRWCRRNPLPASLLGAVVLVFLIGFAGTALGLVEARRQEQVARDEATAKEQARAAEAEQRSVAEEQREKAQLAAAAEKEASAKAQKRLAQVEKANEMLASIFENLDPMEIAKHDRPLQAILVEKLDRAVAQLEGESIGDPEVVAAMQHKFGTSLLGLGEPRKAIVVLEKAVKTRKAKLGPEHPATLVSMNQLGAAYIGAGKSDLALPHFKSVLAIRKAKLGPEHPDTLSAMNNLAGVYRTVGETDRAREIFEETLKLQKVRLGADHTDTLVTMNNVAKEYLDLGKVDVALPLFKETLRRFEATLGPEHPHTIASMNNLGWAYNIAGNRDRAEALLEKALKLSKAKLGLEHPQTLYSLNCLAGVYQAAGKKDLALPLYEETLRLRKAKLGPDHPITLESTNALGVLCWQMGQLKKSIPLFEELVKRRTEQLGRNHAHTLHAVANLGVNYKDAGRFSEAIPLLEKIYRAAKKEPTLRFVGLHLLDAYVKAGENVKLAELFQGQVSEIRKAVPPNSPYLAGLLAQVGLAHLEQKKWAEAEPLLRESLAIREQLQPDAWTTFNTKSMLGGALVGQKKYADAEPLLLAGYEGMKKQQAKIPPEGRIRLREAVTRLVDLYEEMGKKDKVSRWREELAAIRAAREKPPEKP